MRSIKKRNPRTVSLLAFFSIFYPLRFFIRFFVSLLILPFLYRLPFPQVWEFGQRKKRHYAAGMLLLTLFALRHNSNPWNSSTLVPYDPTKEEADESNTEEATT